MHVSRGCGLVIVLSLLVAFLVASFAHVQLDSTVVLAFLGIAGGLLALPSGWKLVKQNGGSPK